MKDPRGRRATKVEWLWTVGIVVVVVGLAALNTLLGSK